MEKFSTRLYNAMLMRELRQIDLARKTGIPRGSINQYISGRSVPSDLRIKQIASALDVPEDWLRGKDVELTDDTGKDQLIAEIEKMYAQLDPQRQEDVRDYVRMLYAKSAEKKEEA